MSYLSDELYKTVTNSVPMVCVDVIPVRRIIDKWEIGIITRATKPQPRKATLLGGRVHHGETLGKAVTRHMQTDWGISAYSFFGGSDEFRPFMVQQYFHASQANAPFGYDPTKHSVAPTFLITLHAEPSAKNEAAAFHWITRDTIPKNCGYNQDIVMRAAFDYLESLS